MASSPLEILRTALPLLLSQEAKFCLTGGLAASIYRSQPRLTQDVDIAIAFEDMEEAKSSGKQLLRRLGYTPSLGFIDTSNLPEQQALVMVTSLADESREGASVDLLLPTLPWVTFAVERAQHNQIDFGFGHVPTITPEDLIISKLYSLKADPERFQDLDDLKSIAATDITLDRDYLTHKAASLKLDLSAQVRGWYKIATC